MNNSPLFRKIVQFLLQEQKKGRLDEAATALKIALREEKQRDTKFIRNLNTTVYISNKFRKGSGGEDRPKMKLSISLTPGKTLELERVVMDETEANKFATNIKVECERMFAEFDKKIDELKTKYGLKVQEEEPAPAPVPAVDEPAEPQQKQEPTPQQSKPAHLPPQSKTPVKPAAKPNTSEPAAKPVDKPAAKPVDKTTPEQEPEEDTQNQEDNQEIK